ncbi:MAG: leucine--tRNA ligase [Candidatus Giovannonibacteria bacterium]|nr:leucine--tRNA ligase [Candidatus Giovannonibacteria bacterium]
MPYDHKKIEKKWQKEWEKSGIYKTPDEVKGKENFYTLVEFPYPSGNLHTGHWYAFSVPDIFARKKRMERKNVMFPIGFDAFGLPAENAAIQRKINPKKWTYENIDYMRKQIKSMGASFDWTREVITSDPEYYKWTQWIFLKLFEKGLAYQAETPVNWCPKDKTVLANEQVVGGKCERCGTEVVQKNMKQWMLKITDYAERLLSGLDKLNWKEEIKEAQKNWIGKSEGAEIDFEVKNSKEKIKVFTTRPDTLFGATYMVLAPEHPLISNFKSQISNFKEVEKYITEAKKKTQLQRQKEEKEKTGVELKGIKAINPANKEEIPIWIADYVLMGYGTGAIMAVPAHDERDFEFSKKFNLPIVDRPLIDKDEIVKKVGGKKVIQYRLRDWVVSRQRYWGAPIPVIHCEKCLTQAVPEKDLPVLLPEIKDYKPRDDGKSPLAKAEKWLKVKCPTRLPDGQECGGNAERETDTLDTFVDSSWYFLRYCDPKNPKAFASAEKLKTFMPVGLYSGGAEHTTMHLLYSRFFYKAMFDLGLVPKELGDEPYLERRNRGIILGPDGQKMSKSKGNVIDPDEYVEKFGADTVRMYLAFLGPYNEAGSYPWNQQGILGIKRFLDRVWKITSPRSSTLGVESPKTPSVFPRSDVARLLHKTIKKVGEDIEKFSFNTAISALMILLNEMEKVGASAEDFGVFLKLLAPFAPHLTEEIWSKLGNKNSIHTEEWPKYDPKLIEETTFELIVQINGKVRDKFEAPAGISEAEATSLTLSREKVKSILGDKKPSKIIFIPRRLINFVI